MIQTVIKRDGRKEPFNPQKCNDWIKWASADIQEHVDWSSIVLKTIRTLPEEVTAKQLQDGMIRTCLDMNSYGYNKMAGRLYSQALKKEIYAWNNRKHPHIKVLHDKMIAAGVIVKPNYSDEEYNEINKMLKHERDLTYAHYSLHLVVSKYALQDRVRKVAYETPQFAMMRVAMQTMNNYRKEDRLKKLEELYTHISFQRLCVPTPYWTSSLTKNTNVASCCVIKSDDTAESIGVATTLAYSMTCAGAGIGTNFNTRSIGAAVRGGAIQHTGKIPYYRYAAAAVKSSKQGCYDDQTEILTTKGWKLGVELTEDDIVAQVNDDLSFSFIKPKRIINYDYNGRMYRLLCENAYDLLLTPEHKVWFTKHPTHLEKEYWNSIEVKDFEPSNDTILHSTRHSSLEEIMPLSGVFVEKTQENYSGKVWCVEVETGRVLVKRNGIIHVSGNSRGGALTMYYPFTDPELFDLLILKNPLTVTAKRLRELDYGVIVNKWLFQRAAKKQDIYLFDSSEAPELYEAIFTDTPEEFEYKMNNFAITNPSKVKAVPALDVLKAIMKERMETGRVYLFFADEVNRHTPFKETIYSSNLCCEIALVTKGYSSYEDLYNTESEGITAFCNLAGITLDKISSDEEYQDVAYYALFMIDEGINNADLGFPQLNKSIRDWRSAGVGVLGLAHLMAKNKLSYSSQEGKDFMHRLAERHSYALHKAAVRLTKERGLAPNTHRTKYPDGWLPIDTYNRNVDELTKEPLHFDWEALREEIKVLGGLHFTVLDTIPPSETSSQACETSNAVYPIREGSIVKVSGDTTTNFVAPEYETLKDHYDIAWEVPTKDMISVYAIWQKFISQGISCDFWIDRSKNRDVSTKQLIQELFWCNKYGLKGNYYYNTKMDADVVAGAIASTTFEENDKEKLVQQDEPGCGSGGCAL
jgi:ribonucleoside triphosphate reductase alpha chain|nr:MAG TPA: ribonucleoside-diphosphate reductase subunit alpha [Caudoviricetes sp.]